MTFSVKVQLRQSVSCVNYRGALSHVMLHNLLHTNLYFIYSLVRTSSSFRHQLALRRTSLCMVCCTGTQRQRSGIVSQGQSKRGDVCSVCITSVVVCPHLGLELRGFLQPSVLTLLSFGGGSDMDNKRSSNFGSVLTAAGCVMTEVHMICQTVSPKENQVAVRAKFGQEYGMNQSKEFDQNSHRILLIFTMRIQSVLRVNLAWFTPNLPGSGRILAIFFTAESVANQVKSHTFIQYANSVQSGLTTYSVRICSNPLVRQCINMPANTHACSQQYHR